MDSVLIYSSLRSKRFQSRSKKKKGGRGRGRGEEVPSFPSPSPVLSFFFLLSSQLSRRTREETLATQAKYIDLVRAKSEALYNIKSCNA